MNDSTWRIWTDGSCVPNPGTMGIGVAILDPAGQWHKISRCAGPGTSNVAEWLAVIAALEEALRLGARRVELRLDSELVAKQLAGEYQVKAANLLPLYEHARRLEEFLDLWVRWVPRYQNTMADMLANQALEEVLM